MLSTPYSHELKWPAHLKPYHHWDDEIKKNPFPHYAWMLEHAPVMRVQTPKEDTWFLSRHRDVQFAFRTPKIFSSQIRPETTGYPHLLLRDGSEHTRLRSVVAHAFTPRAVAAIELKVKELVEAKLRKLLEAGGGELMSNLAAPLTAETIASLLGLPLSESDHYRQWTDDFSAFLGRLCGTARGSPTDESGTNAFVGHIEKALANAPHEGDSLLSSVARARREGKITPEEAVTFGPILFTTGTETTTMLIGNGFVFLSENPQLLTRMRNSPQDVPKFVEELVRYRSSVQRSTRRTTTDVEVSGHQIPAGSFINLVLGAANRDPEKFSNPNEFDMDRTTGGAVGFGFGVHACLGSWLARMESRLVFEALSRTVSKIELDPDPERGIVPYTGGNGTILGPKFMTVKFTRAA